MHNVTFSDENQNLTHRVNSSPVLNLKGTSRKSSKEELCLENKNGPKGLPPPFKGLKQEPRGSTKKPRG